MASITFQGPAGWPPMSIPIPDEDFLDTLQGLCLVHGYSDQVVNPDWIAWQSIPAMIANPAFATYIAFNPTIDDPKNPGTQIPNPAFSEPPAHQIPNPAKTSAPAEFAANPVLPNVFAAQQILNNCAEYANAMRKYRVDQARISAVPDHVTAIPPRLF